MSPDLAFLAEAIPHEIVQALSSLRWLAVTARGFKFRFRQSINDLDLVAMVLSTRYFLTGVIESRDRKIAVTPELTDTAFGKIPWADRFAASLDGIDDFRAQIVAHLVSALETHIP